MAHRLHHICAMIIQRSIRRVLAKMRVDAIRVERNLPKKETPAEIAGKHQGTRLLNICAVLIQGCMRRVLAKKHADNLRLLPSNKVEPQEDAASGSVEQELIEYTVEDPVASQVMKTDQVISPARDEDLHTAPGSVEQELIESTVEDPIAPQIIEADQINLPDRVAESQEIESKTLQFDFKAEDLATKDEVNVSIPSIGEISCEDPSSCDDMTELTDTIDFQKFVRLRPLLKGNLYSLADEVDESFPEPNQVLMIPALLILLLTAIWLFRGVGDDSIPEYSFSACSLPRRLAGICQLDV
jgi:hypothetical protein